MQAGRLRSPVIGVRMVSRVLSYELGLLVPMIALSHCIASSLQLVTCTRQPISKSEGSKDVRRRWDGLMYENWNPSCVSWTSPNVMDAGERLYDCQEDQDHDVPYVLEEIRTQINRQPRTGIPACLALSFACACLVGVVTAVGCRIGLFRLLVVKHDECG